MAGGYPCCCIESSSTSLSTPSYSSGSTDSSASEAALNCARCDAGRTPNTMKLVLGGVLNDRCAVCGNQNGTYYLFNSFSNPCSWDITIPIDCEGTCGFIISPSILSFSFSITRGTTDFNFSLSLKHSTTVHYGWNRLIPHNGRLTLDCCDLENLNLVPGGGGSPLGCGTRSWCDYDFSTAHITAINCGGPNVFL